MPRHQPRDSSPPLSSARSAELSPTNSDADLVARACAGERFAVDALYRRHAHMITRLCGRVMQHTGDADDAVQDTFVHAFERLRDLREPSALRPWLARIALHVCKRKLRRRSLLRLCGLGRSAEDGLPLPDAHEGARPDLRLELEAIERKLSAEPVEPRAVWLLHRVEGLSIQETATASGRSVATVKRYVAAVDARLGRLQGESDDA